ncbi:MAG: hypothetical protein ABC611_01795 [Candidatus Methanosuratincola petrocarbonis]
MRVGIAFPLLATLLFFLAASRPALCAPAAGSLTRVYGTVSGSFQEWQGGTSILQGSDISVEGSTVTISGGNITVYGSLTIQDAIISGGADVSILVAGNGRLKTNNSRLAPEIRLVVMDSAEAEIYGSQAFIVECRNSSKVKVIRSQVSQIRVFDDSVQYLEGLFGMMTDVDKYRTSYSPCPRTEIYNCSLRSVREWGEGSSLLSVAHSSIGFLQTRGRTEITFDNMSVVWNWTHNGSLVWLRRQHDHIGNCMIVWGETYAGGEIDSNGAEIVIRQLEVVDSPPAQLPPGMLSAGKFINMTLYGPKWAKKETMCFINFTGNQVAGLDLSTLKIYSYTPGSGWQ